MPSYTDEQLVAYADGELPAAEAGAIAEAAARDPALAQRIARFVETRRVLQEAFARTLEEPVPARLLDAAAPARTGPRAAPARWRWAPMALAASLALAVGLGVSLRHPDGPVSVAGLPPDAAALATALERHASGVPLEGVAGGVGYEILPVATLRVAQGHCRQFESSAGAARARAVACRAPDGHWTTVAAVAIADAPAEAGDRYVPASGGDVDLVAALGASTPLTPAEEADLIQNRWQKNVAR